MGLTIELQNLVNERAKSKKDGIYNFRGCSYRVRDNRVTHYAYGGKILMSYGAFNVQVGTCGIYQTEQVEVLKGIKDD